VSFVFKRLNYLKVVVVVIVVVVARDIHLKYVE